MVGDPPHCALKSGFQTLLCAPFWKDAPSPVTLLPPHGGEVKFASLAGAVAAKAAKTAPSASTGRIRRPAQEVDPLPIGARPFGR